MYVALELGFARSAGSCLSRSSSYDFGYDVISDCCQGAAYQPPRPHILILQARLTAVAADTLVGAAEVGCL